MWTRWYQRGRAGGQVGRISARIRPCLHNSCPQGSVPESVCPQVVPHKVGSGSLVRADGPAVRPVYLPARPLDAPRWPDPAGRDPIREADSGVGDWRVRPSLYSLFSFLFALVFDQFRTRGQAPWTPKAHDVLCSQVKTKQKKQKPTTHLMKPYFFTKRLHRLVSVQHSDQCYCTVAH